MLRARMISHAPLQECRSRMTSPRQYRLAVLVAALALAGCGGSYQWGWYVVLPTTPAGRSNLLFLLGGMGWTVLLATAALLVSVPIGLAVALAALARRRPATAFNRVWVELFRAIPLLVLLLWVYYGLPVVLGLSLGPFAAGVIALALSDSAFEAEIFRAGIQSVEAGQREAALALGLSPWQAMRLVILPQALRRVLPALGNQLVYLLKMSSLVSVVGLAELTRKANELVVSLYRPLEVYSFLVLEYLALILLASWLVRRLEARLAAPYPSKG
jgi:polar amino acid transport system permease protein